MLPIPQVYRARGSAGNNRINHDYVIGAAPCIHELRSFPGAHFSRNAERTQPLRRQDAGRIVSALAVAAAKNQGMFHLRLCNLMVA